MKRAAGFWLARFLMRRGVEVHVMQPSSLPVDRRARRAKTDVIDVEMLLRTLMEWRRDEPRVCSMVPIPDAADEEARRAHCEREDLVRERRSILNKIDAILATLGVKGYRGLRCPMALCQGRRHSGGSEDEDGIRTTFVFVHFR
jgi:transposase